MFDFVTNLILTLGALGVGLVMFLENLFPPIPSELVMPLAGFQVAQGKMSLVLVFVLGTLGAVAGAYLWYWVGRRIGQDRLLHFIDRYGLWLSLTRQDVTRAIDWFERHQGAAVFFCRMVPGLRTLISVPAGLARMPLSRFFLLTAAGTAIWNAALIAAGRVLSANYARVADYLDPVTTALLVAFVAAYLYRIARRLLA